MIAETISISSSCFTTIHMLAQFNAPSTNVVSTPINIFRSWTERVNTTAPMSNNTEKMKISSRFTQDVCHGQADLPRHV